MNTALALDGKDDCPKRGELKNLQTRSNKQRANDGLADWPAEGKGARTAAERRPKSMAGKKKHPEGGMRRLAVYFPPLPVEAVHWPGQEPRLIAEQGVFSRLAFF